MLVSLSFKQIALSKVASANFTMPRLCKAAIDSCLTISSSATKHRQRRQTVTSFFVFYRAARTTIILSKISITLLCTILSKQTLTRVRHHTWRRREALEFFPRPVNAAILVVDSWYSNLKE